MNTPQTTTVLSSIRLDGEKAFTTYQGGTTGERFVQYLKETLAFRQWLPVLASSNAQATWPASPFFFSFIGNITLNAILYKSFIPLCPVPGGERYE